MKISEVINAVYRDCPNVSIRYSCVDDMFRITYNMDSLAYQEIQATYVRDEEEALMTARSYQQRLDDGPNDSSYWD